MPLLLDLEWTPALLGLIDDLYRSGTGARGRVYAEGGQVRNFTISEDGRLIRAAVQGSTPRPYLIELRLDEEEFVTAGCSCPVAVDCKHAYAVALTLLGQAYRSGSKHHSEIRRYLPAAWKNYAWSPAHGLFAGIPQLFVKVAGDEIPAPGPAKASAPLPADSRPAPADSRPAPSASPVPSAALTGWGVASRRNTASVPPPPPPQPWWLRLWNAATDKVRETCLLEAHEERFGSNRYFYPYDYVHQLKGLRNNAAILVQLEGVLAAFAPQGGRQIHPPDPQYLDFVNSPQVRGAYQDYMQSVWRGHLKDWMEGAAPPPAPQGAQSCTLELAWKLQPSAAGIPLAAFELLITTAKMDRRPRKAQAIRQLYNELRAGTRAAQPLMRELVEWLATHPDTLPEYTYYHKRPWHDEHVIPVTRVLSWITAWGARDLLRWDDGAPVRFDPRPARLVIERTAEGRDLWAVELPPPPGAGADEPPVTEPLAEAAVFGESPVEDPTARIATPPAFYVRRGGTIHPLDACGMGLAALAAARALAAAPLDLFLARPHGMKLMRRLVCSRPQDSGGLVQTVALQPVVEIKYLRASAFWVAVYGRSACGRVFLRDPHGEWAAAPEGEDARRWLEESPFGFHAQEGETLASLAGHQAAEAPSPAPGGPPAGEAPVARLIVPRLEDLAPLEAWLGGLIPPKTPPLSQGQERYAYQWPAMPETIAHVLRFWAERPPGPHYLGNAEFLKLITPAQRPRLKVSAESFGMDWLQVSIEMEQDLERLGARDIEALLTASSDALIRLPDGRYYRRDGLEEYQRELKAIEDAGLLPGAEKQRLHAFHLAGEAGRTLIELGGRDEHLAELGRAARKLVDNFRGIPTARIAKETAAFLRPYQRAGADFLVWAATNFGGALLADDMGLGKTLQVLAALTALRAGEKKHKPSLVICPASVAHNWQREARRFAPRLKTLVIERGQERKALWERFAEYDVVIKNYALTRRDADVLRNYDWLMVCVDEAQAIKNPASDIASVVKSIPARYRIALTGTPIENRLSDLLSIMEFTTPGFLPHMDGAEPAQLAQRLRAFLRPVLLRRLKSEVAPELPERIEERIDCAMTENQRLAYLAEVRRTRELLHGLPGQKVAGAGRIQILAALTRLRQLCCDPALLQLNDLGSGKVKELLALIPPILESGHKVLLFSQFVRMLNRLQDHLKQEGIRTYLLTGKTQHRQELVDTFEKDTHPSVFLISLKAGGTGLNLVSASHVVLFDPWWNPAVEAQAIDRTHRIGQDKTVLAFRLVSEGTIEERILELQEQKRGLVRGVLEEESFNRTLSRDDFEFLLQ